MRTNQSLRQPGSLSALYPNTELNDEEAIGVDGFAEAAVKVLLRSMFKLLLYQLDKGLPVSFPLVTCHPAAVKEHHILESSRKIASGLKDPLNLKYSILTVILVFISVLLCFFVALIKH